MHPDQQALEELVHRIVEAVHPLKIILFGSAAGGEMGPDSDVDVMVVMPEGTHRLDTMGYLYRTVRGVRVPFDVVVVTPEDLERYADRPGLIYKTALREGENGLCSLNLVHLRIGWRTRKAIWLWRRACQDGRSGGHIGAFMPNRRLRRQ